MGKELFTTEQFIKAIPGTGGLITTIAERVGCSWNTAKKYIDAHQTVKDAYESEREKINDLAVNTILKAIKDGDTQLAKWWLAKKRKDEFGESIDVTSGGKAIEFSQIIQGRLAELSGTELESLYTQFETAARGGVTATSRKEEA